jgi:REP element-mobilizing transposase RayT
MTKAKKRSSTQTTQTKKSRQEHGGSLAIGRRRKTRPLNIKQSHHITLKSIHAVGPRSLFRHKKMILSLMKKNSVRFQVKVYEYAIQGNHIHLLIKAQSREGMQNFFRVIAGHSAQRILKEFPLSQNVGGALGYGENRARGGASGYGERRVGCKKNQRVFWSYLVYSRVVSWGREFDTVTAYIQKNTLELLQIIAYQPRFKSENKNSS